MDVIVPERKPGGGFRALLLLVALFVGIPGLAVYTSTKEKPASHKEQPASRQETYSLAASPVSDNAHIFSAQERDSLASFLEDLDRRTGIQIAVLTVPSMNGEDIESFSLRHAEQWKLGQAGADNGVLVTVAMKEHDVRIETGYGSEGTLTDALCARIIRNVIVPAFQRGEYAQGISSGVKSIAAVLTSDESLVSARNETAEAEKNGAIPAPVLLLIVLVYLIIFMAVFSGTGRRIWWLPFFFGGGGRSGFSGGSRGSGRGFRGGGGSFGGGGASGHW